MALTKITTNVIEDNAITADKIDTSSLTAAGFATEGYVATAVANLVDSAPLTLDTLNELAAALGDDPNFATTVTNSIATKLPLSGGTLTGALTGTTATFSSLDVDVHPVMHDGISGGSVSDATNGGGVNYVYNAGTATPTRGSCGTHIYHQWSNNLVLNLSDSSWQQGDVVVVKNVRGAVNITVNATVIYLPTGSSDTSVTFNGTVGSFTLIKYNTTTGQWMV